MIERIDLLCRNWRAWIISGGIGAPAQVRSWWGPLILDRNVAATGDPDHIPVNDNAAWRLHEAIERLPEHLRQTVGEAYLHLGTAEQKAGRLGCSVRTFYDRLDAAHRTLDQTFSLAPIAISHTDPG